jgi:hypothetical protein
MLFLCGDGHSQFVILVCDRELVAIGSESTKQDKYKPTCTFETSCDETSNSCESIISSQRWIKGITILGSTQTICSRRKIVIIANCTHHPPKAKTASKELSNNTESLVSKCLKSTLV